MSQLLLILLLPFELLQPVSAPQEMILYVDQNPAALVYLLPEQDDAAVADNGVYRIQLSWISEPLADLDSWFNVSGELLIERSRRRGAVYTLHPHGLAPEIVDLTSFSGRIPADFSSRIAVRGDSLVIPVGTGTESSDDIELHVDFLPGTTLLRFPGTGYMLILL